MKKHKKGAGHKLAAQVSDSSGAVAGHHNTLNTNSLCNLELEMILYFRALSLPEKVQALDYMIKLHENNI